MPKLKEIDWVPILAASLFLISVIWALSALLPSIPNPYEPPNDAAAQQAEWIRTRFSDWDWTAFATCVIAAYAILQYREFRKSSQRQLRAYVSALPKKMALGSDNRTITVLVMIQNMGPTPAFKTQCLWDVQVLDHPMKKPFRFHPHPEDKTKPIPSWVSYPNSEHMMPKPHVLTEADLANIQAGTHAIYAFGRITYVDAFRVGQEGEFCAYIDKGVLDIWWQQAQSTLDRQPIAAPFKFTEWNNTASFQ
jgi:hypothetical protein